MLSSVFTLPKAKIDRTYRGQYMYAAYLDLDAGLQACL